MYPYLILVGYADTDTRIHHFSGFFFLRKCVSTYPIRIVSDTRTRARVT